MAPSSSTGGAKKVVVDYTGKYIDLWLVRRILKTGNLAERRALEEKIENGLRIRDEHGQFVSGNLSDLSRSLESEA